MLALDVTDSWLTYTIISSVPGVGTYNATFVPSGTVRCAVDWATEFLAWVNAAGRPWAFAWALKGWPAWRTSWGRAMNGGLALSIHTGAPSGINSSGALAPMGLPTWASAQVVNGRMVLAANSAAYGTWYPRGGLSLDGLSGDLDAGAAGPTFGARPGAPGLAALSGRAEAAGLLVDAARLTGLLTSVQQPIKGRVFNAVDQTWHYVQLGEVSRSTRNPGLYGWTLEVWQEP